MNRLRIRLKELFKQDNIQEISAKEFVQFEARLYLINNLNNRVPVDAGWSVFTGYFDVFRDKDETSESKKNIFNLKKENHSYSTSTKWKNIKEKYFKVDEKYRLFDINDKGYLKLIVPKYESDRTKIYDKYFKEIDKSKSNEFSSAEETIEYESRIKKDGMITKKIYKTDVVDMDTEVSKTINLYKNKKYIDLYKDKDWSVILKEMGEGFDNRPNISMNILNMQDKIQLKGPIHIVGALGSGKSTYKYVQVYEGVKKHGLKIGIIEDTVSNVISTMKILRKLGINAVPIIGATTEEKHLINYLINKDNYDDIEDDEVVELLSGNCIVKAISKDIEDDIGYPCNRLLENNEKVNCPYADKCGHMERFRQISDADVLITTPHSLVKGNIPNFIDNYNRSIYEIFYDILDMIIVDEADGVQGILDKQLMPSIKINYGEDSLIDKFIELKGKLNRDDNSRENLAKHKFIKNVQKFEDILYNTERILPKLKYIKSYIINKMWTSIEVFKNIEATLNKINRKDNKKFIKLLNSYVDFTDTFNISEDNLTHELNELYNKISDIHILDQYPEQRLIEEVKFLLEKYNVKISNNVNKDLFIEKIAFLIILVQIDYMLKIISNEYPYMSYKTYGTTSYVDTFNSVNRKLDHLVKEACIGTVYGYKFSFNKGLNLDALRYDGVGRSLLELWANIKEDKGLLGPCVIYLSGTSYSPGSAHYNLKKEPDILLTGKTEGDINMKFIPKVHEDQYIKISGTSNRDIRIRKLIELTKKLILEIKVELEYLNGRKVLMVVNSYDDCNVVGEVLKSQNMNYLLVSDEKKDDTITKDYIESISETNIDVCVVPLSIIARGYNILNDENNSYFGSMFFLIRPYMIPGDFKSYIQILHHYLNGICSNIHDKNCNYLEKVDLFRKICYMKYSDILDMSYWKLLNSEEKEIMSWFMIVPIKQAIGRMQRNGNDCNVFFCDAAFSQSIMENEKVDIKNSILYSWYDILQNCIDNEVISHLYGKFFAGLEKMIDEINLDVDYYEEEEWD